MHLPQKLTLLFITLIFCFLYGCATITPETRQEYVKTHPNLKENIKQALLEGKIIIGMVKEDVKATWGEPEDITKNNSAWNSFEQWTYGNCLYACSVLYFNAEGKLVDFDQTQH